MGPALPLFRRASFYVVRVSHTLEHVVVLGGHGEVLLLFPLSAFLNGPDYLPRVMLDVQGRACSFCGTDGRVGGVEVTVNTICLSAWSAHRGFCGSDKRWGGPAPPHLHFYSLEGSFPLDTCT